VALQVHAAQPAHVAQPGEVERDDFAEEVGIGDEAIERVVG
jgi:hypothetical protein